MLAGQFDELKEDLTCVRILKVRHYYVDFYTMISLMQYRASVGLHDNFLKAKELSHCVKGQFWSTLLFMFYLETIYLPLLQRQVHLWQMNYYVGLWFSQMWLYCFYFPLLIRLANDVETNPGPLFLVQSALLGWFGGLPR